MRRQDEERESPAGPGAVARAVLRAIDACAAVLQRLRDRVAGTAARTSPDDRRRPAAAEHAVAEGTAPAAAPSRLRRLLVGLILLLAGGATGALLAYRTLADRLDGHAAVVERMQEEVDATRKEDARNVRLLDKFQRENAEYRHAAREAEREAEIRQRRIEALEAQIEETKRAEEAKRADLAARAARSAAVAAPRARPRAPVRTADCAAGTAGDVSDCIKEFNR